MNGEGDEICKKTPEPALVSLFGDICSMRLIEFIQFFFYEIFKVKF